MKQSNQEINNKIDYIRNNKESILNPNPIDDYQIFNTERIGKLHEYLNTNSSPSLFTEEFNKMNRNGSWITSSYIDEPTIQNKQLEDLITQIRDSFNGSIEVYTKGSCIKFCMILKTVFPNGIILYNSDHAIFELNSRCYDITGEVVKLDSHIPIEQYGILKCYELMNLKYSI